MLTRRGYAVEFVSAAKKIGAVIVRSAAIRAVEAVFASPFA
jgi:hypothetical protein